MTSKIAPNPHSPYASAAPDVRHIFASPIFFPDPNPGVLALTACEGMAVVPDELVQTKQDAVLPDGLCPLCVTVMQGGKPPKRESSQCSECESATWHGDLCALCRQDKHEAWWPTREQPACGDANDGDWCELEPGHEGHHRADTVEWPAAVETGE